MTTCRIAVLLLLPLLTSRVDSADCRIDVPLSDGSGVTISGPHQFLAVDGEIGYRPTSLKTEAILATSLHRGKTGTLSLWVSPMEHLERNHVDASHLPDAALLNYSIVSDGQPPWKIRDAGFALSWNPGFPSLTMRFQGGKFWDSVAYGKGAYVYAEHLALRKGCWYHVVVTWDAVAGRTSMYVNGMRVGHNPRASGFVQPGDTLRIGNPMMIVRDLSIQEDVLDAGQVVRLYEAGRPEACTTHDNVVAHENKPRDLPPLGVTRDASWRKAYSCSFTQAEDLMAWTRQTGKGYLGQFDVRTSPEGLVFRTPDTIDYDSRMNLWCPKLFEGDIWVQYDFRPEGPEGLALLIVHASGVQREDVIGDHGLLETGAMGPMMSRYRNYHWEYLRRVPFIRKDVETQYVHKNPTGKLLQYACIPKLQEGRWYSLRFVKIGSRLHGAIDGKTVFDVTDVSSDGSGPVYDFGRIAIRQMYQTKMRYRNLVVYTRGNEGREVSR